MLVTHDEELAARAGHAISIVDGQNVDVTAHIVLA